MFFYWRHRQVSPKPSLIFYIAGVKKTPFNERFKPATLNNIQHTLMAVVCRCVWRLLTGVGDGQAVLTLGVVPGRGRIWFRGSASLVNRCFSSFLWRWDFLCGCCSHTFLRIHSSGSGAGFCRRYFPHHLFHRLFFLPGFWIIFLLHLFYSSLIKKKKVFCVCKTWWDCFRLRLYVTRIDRKEQVCVPHSAMHYNRLLVFLPRSI